MEKIANERETTRRKRKVMTLLCAASFRRRHLMAYKNADIILGNEVILLEGSSQNCRKERSKRNE